MVELTPIQYHETTYPNGITPTIFEVAGHFDIVKLRINDESYSLHTEYSYGKREFDSSLIQRYPTLVKSSKRGIPQLWHSDKWAEEFALFILELCKGHKDPDIIEVHPPFSDYSSISTFLDCFKVFEAIVSMQFPSVKILVENRYGTTYQGGKFIVSRIEDLILLSNTIDLRSSNLRITLDLPQLLTAHGFNNSKPELLDELFDKIGAIRHNISGIHLWGKRKSPSGRRVSHCGDLKSFFDDDDIIKGQFLSKMIDVFDDGIVRYFVPEVNSGNDDLTSIVNDMQETGFSFR